MASALEMLNMLQSMEMREKQFAFQQQEWQQRQAEYQQLLAQQGAQTQGIGRARQTMWDDIVGTAPDSAFQLNNPQDFSTVVREAGGPPLMAQYLAQEMMMNPEVGPELGLAYGKQWDQMQSDGRSGRSHLERLVEGMPAELKALVGLTYPDIKTPEQFLNVLPKVLQDQTFQDNAILYNQLTATPDNQVLGSVAGMPDVQVVMDRNTRQLKLVQGSTAITQTQVSEMPPERQEAMGSSLKLINMMNQLEPIMTEVFSDVPVWSRLKGLVQDTGTYLGMYGQDAPQYVWKSISDTLTADAQSMVKGIPSNFDAKVFRATMPQSGDSLAVAKRKLKQAKDYLKTTAADTVAYYQNVGKPIPPEVLARARAFGVDLGGRQFTAPTDDDYSDIKFE
jgi:hypothetical protein